MSADAQISKPYLRRIVCTIGPVSDWIGAKAGFSDTLRFESDGTPEALRVNASIQKTLMGMPDPSKIDIYNLSEATRNAMRNSLTEITLEAGWRNSELHKVFKGSVLSVQSQRSGPDIVTSVTALPGLGAIAQAAVTKTYAAGMPVRDVVRDIGEQITGIEVKAQMLKDIPGVIGKGGWSFAGSAKDALTELANEYGFSWSVDDNLLMAVGDTAKFDGMIELDGESGALINVAPMLQGPMQLQTGVSINAIYAPGVIPGTTVRVKSTIAGALSGDYRIHTARYNLDCYSDSWTMALESFSLFNG